MEQRFPLEGGRGWLEMRSEGPRAVCTVCLPNDGRGLYKAYLTGAEGELLLGTLLPENGRLGLRRTFSLDELGRRGVWPPLGGEVRLSFAAGSPGQGTPEGWTCERAPARLMGEALLSAALEGRSALLRREEAGFSLALPFDTGRPFALPLLFCFARTEDLAGRSYAVFPFRADGMPRTE